MNRFLIYVLGVSLLLNLAVAFFCYNHESRFIDPDSNDYIKLADNLAGFKGYTKGSEPEIFRVPGYSFFLSPFRYIFPHSIFPVIIVQCILSTASILLLWHLTLYLTLGNKTIAKVATIIQALSLSSIVAANKILTETLFTFLLLLFLFFLAKTVIYMKINDQKSSGKKYFFTFATGITAGLLVLVRAIFLPLFPLFLIYLWISGISSFQKGNRAGVYKLILIMFFPYLLSVGGWSLRNSLTAGYNGFSSVGSINIYRYYSCALSARQNGSAFSDEQRICDANLSAAGNEVQQAAYSLEHGIPVLKSAPLTYLFLHLKTDINTLFPAVGDFYALMGKNIGGKGTLSVINSRGIAAGIKHYFAGNWTLFFLAMPVVFLLILKYLLAAAGAGRKIFSKNIDFTAVIYIISAVYMIIIPGAVSHPRFRVPIEPILSLFAGIGLYFMLELINNLEAEPTRHCSLFKKLSRTIFIRFRPKNEK
jgi:hypothetical protein